MNNDITSLRAKWDATKIGNLKIAYLNKKEFHSVKQEIFLESSYALDLDNESPIIIDIGAHIGLSVLYFKQIYPDATILAFEPNPHLFELLNENIFVNNADKVTALNSAVSDREGEVDFYIDESDSYWFSNSSIFQRGWSGMQTNKLIKVNQINLSQFIDQTIDLLKIDIEGDEARIIYSISSKLHLVKNIIIEFHNNGKQDLSKLMSFLNSKGFDLKFFVEGVQTEKILQEKLFIIKASK